MKKSLTNESPSARSILTKNSRLTKKNSQNDQYSNSPYFRKDHMSNEVFKRVSAGKQKQNHLEKASSIISDLLNRQQKAKDKLQKLKQEAQKQYQKLCPFTPTTSNNQRYVVTGDVVRRNQLWLREKKKKQLELKEEVVSNNLRECTFSPNFSSKKQSESYLRSRDLSKSLTLRVNTNKSPKTSLIKKINTTTRRDFTETEYELAKRSLISKMMGILN